MAEYCKNCKNMADQITELHKQGNALLLEAAKDRQEIERLRHFIVQAPCPDCDGKERFGLKISGLNARGAVNVRKQCRHVDTPVNGDSQRVSEM